MTGYPGHYSLIQYCPDASRAEAANVGVLLFCPALRFIQVRTAHGNDRVRRFFRGSAVDLDRLNVTKLAIERRVGIQASDFISIDDLERFIATRANDIVLTPPRSIKVTDPKLDLEALFSELVGGRQSAPTQKIPVPELEEPFLQLHREGRASVKVRVEVPLLGKMLTAPYAYRNGVLNLVKPEVLPGSEEQALRRASPLAMQGSLLLRHPGEEGINRRLVIVSGARQGNRERSEDAVAPLFKEFGVRFVRAAEIGGFLAEVQREAHA